MQIQQLIRFEYKGWKGAILAKIKTNREFRSAVTFEKDKIIHVIPGKVSNIFDVEQEVISLMQKNNVLTSEDFNYIKNGVLDEGMREINEVFDATKPNTCTLQTYKQLQINLAQPHKKQAWPTCSFWQRPRAKSLSTIDNSHLANISTRTNELRLSH